MPINVYLLNRTYIAQDRSTGLVAYGESEKVAIEKLTTILAHYWQAKKIVIPVTTSKTSTQPRQNKDHQ